MTSCDNGTSQDDAKQRELRRVVAVIEAHTSRKGWRKEGLFCDVDAETTLTARLAYRGCPDSPAFLTFLAEIPDGEILFSHVAHQADGTETFCVLTCGRVVVTASCLVGSSRPDHLVRFSLQWGSAQTGEVADAKRRYFCERFLAVFATGEMEAAVNGLRDALQEAVPAAAAEGGVSWALQHLGTQCGRQAVQLNAEDYARASPLLEEVEWETEIVRCDDGGTREVAESFTYHLHVPDGTTFATPACHDGYVDLSLAPEMLLVALIGGPAMDLTHQELVEKAEKSLPDFGDFQTFAGDVMTAYGKHYWEFCEGR